MQEIIQEGGGAAFFPVLILASTRTGGASIGWDARLKPVPGSVGEPFPNCEIMLADDAGDEVAKGERGEIWVRSPSLMKRYWNNPKATAETFSDDGWLKTGDIGCQDENGWYYVVDRKKVRDVYALRQPRCIARVN